MNAHFRPHAFCSRHQHHNLPARVSTPASASPLYSSLHASPPFTNNSSMMYVPAPDDRIVVIMGSTGTGKSTFIERATGQDSGSVGHGLDSHTEDIQTFRVTHPTDDFPIVFVDTPGFNDTSKSDVEILCQIADFLVKAYKGNVNLATIIYLHKISDNRMTGSLRMNLDIFVNLCGKNAMPKVVIATTMWGKVDKEDGTMREEELKARYWKDMVADGCRIERFDNTYASAWRIIGNPARTPAPLSAETADTWAKDLKARAMKKAEELRRVEREREIRKKSAKCVIQ